MSSLACDSLLIPLPGKHGQRRGLIDTDQAGKAGKCADGRAHRRRVDLPAVRVALLQRVEELPPQRRVQPQQRELVGAQERALSASPDRGVSVRGRVLLPPPIVVAAQSATVLQGLAAAAHQASLERGGPRPGDGRGPLLQPYPCTGMQAPVADPQAVVRLAQPLRERGERAGRVLVTDDAAAGGDARKGNLPGRDVGGGEFLRVEVTVLERQLADLAALLSGLHHGVTGRRGALPRGRARIGQISDEQPVRRVPLAGAPVRVDGLLEPDDPALQISRRPRCRGQWADHCGCRCHACRSLRAATRSTASRFSWSLACR